MQNEIGELFSYYVYNSGKYKSNGKDYCKKLPQKMNSIEALYNFLSDGNADWDGSFMRPHPSDPRRDRKWEVHSRWYNSAAIKKFIVKNIGWIQGKS